MAVMLFKSKALGLLAVKQVPRLVVVVVVVSPYRKIYRRQPFLLPGKQRSHALQGFFLPLSAGPGRRNKERERRANDNIGLGTAISHWNTTRPCGLIRSGGGRAAAPVDVFLVVCGV